MSTHTYSFQTITDPNHRKIILNLYRFTPLEELRSPSLGMTLKTHRREKQSNPKRVLNRSPSHIWIFASEQSEWPDETAVAIQCIESRNFVGFYQKIVSQPSKFPATKEDFLVEMYA